MKQLTQDQIQAVAGATIFRSESTVASMDFWGIAGGLTAYFNLEQLPAPFSDYAAGRLLAVTLGVCAGRFLGYGLHELRNHIDSLAS